MPIEVPFLPADQNLDPLTQDWGEAYKELCLDKEGWMPFRLWIDTSTDL